MKIEYENTKIKYIFIFYLSIVSIICHVTFFSPNRIAHHIIDRVNIKIKSLVPHIYLELSMKENMLMLFL
jgi:hypothetical protein